MFSHCGRGQISKEASRRGFGISMPRDIRCFSRQDAKQAELDGTVLSRRLDYMTSKSSFKPELFGDSLLFCLLMCRLELLISCDVLPYIYESSLCSLLLGGCLPSVEFSMVDDSLFWQFLAFSLRVSSVSFSRFYFFFSCRSTSWYNFTISYQWLI